ncbi:MAG: hypothetical protein ACE5I7_05080 [Candidatus Binatia bacterium]
MRRQLRLPVEECWQLVHDVLEEQSIDIDAEDGHAYTLTTERVRRSPMTRTLLHELRTIADLRRARARGLRVLSAFWFDYHVALSPLATGTLITITSRIDAVDRSRVVYGLYGQVTVMPRNIRLPSTGVLEQRFLERLGNRVFGAEELLYLLGQPGYD